MLPNIQGPRYGDMLREFYDGMKNNNLSENRLQQIQEQFNGLWARDNNVKGWLRPQDNKIGFNFLELPYEIISSTVLTEDTASLSFAIPNNYKHLMIMAQGRINGTGGQVAVTVRLQFNGDTTAGNYLWGSLFHQNTTVTGVQDLSDPSIAFAGFIADGEATAAFSGSTFAVIPHYNSVFYKTIVTLGANTPSTFSTTGINNGVWKSVSPITSISVFPDPTYASAKFVAGMLFSVYGIR